MVRGTRTVGAELETRGEGEDLGHLLSTWSIRTNSGSLLLSSSLALTLD